MRKCLVLVLFCFGGITYSQTYNFDLLTKYTIKVNGRTVDRVFYSSTKDPNIFLNVGGFFGTSDAFLSDFNNNIYHTYKVKKSDENGEIFFTFKYLKTTKSEVPKFYDEYDYKIDELQSDTLSKVIKVTVYSDSARRVEISTYTLTLKEYDFNLFPLYRVSCMHPLENFLKLNFTGDYIVTSGTGKSKGGFKTVSELSEIKPILLQLVVPE